MVENRDVFIACGLGGMVYMLYEYLTPKLISKNAKENLDKALDGYTTIIGIQELSKVFEKQQQQEL